MTPKKIDSRLSISPQLSIADVATASALGFRSIIVNRPDDEEAGQPSIAEMRQAASAAGLGFAAIPVVPGKITDADAAQFAAALDTLQGPTIAYCRSGVRAATLWAISAAAELGPDAVLGATEAAGYNLDSLRPRLEERSAFPSFTEHRFPRDRGSVYVRDFAGNGPAFVLLHGFPDNLHIYDKLVPHLVSAGRRVIALDFQGFGASDKPAGMHYSFAQQLGDLESVVEGLALDEIIPVGHDAGGPAAVNFALKHPGRTAAVVLMNAFYGGSPGLRVPELIALFSNKELQALSLHFLKSPEQFAWLLDFQRSLFLRGLSDAQQRQNLDFLGPIIDGNFRQQPSAAIAFAQMTAQLDDEVAANTARLVEFRRSEIPLLMIWGKADPYLHVSIAEHLRSQAAVATLHTVEAGHWPQIEAAAEVARLMLEGV